MKAIFLDRDNTLIHDPGYIHQVAQVQILPGVLEACTLFRQLDLELFVISNQSGVGRGFFAESDVLSIEHYLKKIFSERAVELREFRYCFHHPDDKCQCRKPSPLLINQLIAKYSIKRDQSYMVGDRELDAQTGINAGIKGILISNTPHPLFPTHPSLLHFARSIPS